MTDTKFSPSEEFTANAHVDAELYDAMYAASVADPEAFWEEHGKRVDWIKPFSKVKNVTYSHPNVSIKWFEDGTLNVSENCIDRHLPTRRNQTAIIWEGDNPEDSKHISYGELHQKVCKLANVYKSLGVGKGDRVVLYMPMIPEAAYAMLACNRIGAVHSIVFAGFSPEALASRVDDCGAALLVTADEAPRGGKNTPLKANVDKALDICGDVQVLMVERTGTPVAMVSGRDHSYQALMSEASADCSPEEMNAEDPLFILYTSGSTGKPKGVLHTSGGYLVWAAMTHELVFDYHDGDIYWCTADVGWVTGHSYIVYGPLANGATTLMFEGVPTYPDASRFWQVCDKHQVNQFYTAPTAIRALMGLGNSFVEKCSLNSIKVLGTVGEPFGGVQLPDSHFRIDEATGEIQVKHPGVFAGYWNKPEQTAAVLDEHGWYRSGDVGHMDADGYVFLVDRAKDMVLRGGENVYCSEVEAAIYEHPAVAEAAVFGVPDDRLGELVAAAIVPTTNEALTEEDLGKFLAGKLAKFKIPERMWFLDEPIPQNANGKFLKRELRERLIT